MALSQVLSAFCISFSATTGLKIDFNCQDNLPTVSNAYAATIYRMIQEGLANAVKHANASAAWVNLDVVEKEITISLEDNGQGFNVDTAPAGMGLVSIKERFQLLNGSFEIESSVTRGTRLSGSLPILDEHL
jgi:signal transduction histidine kinase